MPSVMSNQLRQYLALDPKIGAGNFIFYALEISPVTNKPLLFSQTGFRGFKDKTLNNLSLDDIIEVVKQYANYFLRVGVAPKDPVIVWLDDGISYFLLYLALNSIGAIPVLLNAKLSVSIVKRFCQLVNAKLLLTQASYQATQKFNQDVRVVNVEDIEWETSPLESFPTVYPYQHDDNDPIMITHSSGTTGMPKAVYLTHGGFFYGLRKLLEHPLMEGFDKLLSALPSSHNSAMAYVSYALLSGIEVMVMKNCLGKPVIDKIADFQPSSIIAFPQTYVDLVRQKPKKALLQSVSYWINSGDAAHKKHIKQLVQYGKHKINGTEVAGSFFVDGLGSSEMGHTLFRIIHSISDQHGHRCIGLPQPWVEAKVFNQQGEELEAGNIGYLGVKAPSVTPGYWNNTFLTCKSKVQGYFLTGDIVKKDKRGLFYHLDRASDVLKLSKQTVYSVLIEEIIMSKLDSVFDCSVFSIDKDGSKKVLLLIETLDKKDKRAVPNTDALNHYLIEEGLPGVISEIHFISKALVPIGVTGKVLKRKLREKYAIA